MQAVDLSSQSVDLDTLNDPGKWHINGATATNSPTTGVFSLIVEVGLSKRRVQTAIDISTGETFRRVRTNTQAWQSWHQIYDTSLLTNSTLLSPLASALGVLRIYLDPLVDGVWDLDTLTVNTIQYPPTSHRPAATHTPISLQECAVITLAMQQDWKYTIQFVINRDYICYRYRLQAGWQSWKKVSLTNV